MNPRKNKIKNTLKIRSYMDIKKRGICGGQKTGAKLLVFQELSSCWRGLRLKDMKGKVMLKKALAVGMIITVIITAYFQNVPQTRAATSNRS